MQAFQQRVVDEFDELNIKQDALTKFIRSDKFKELDGENRSLLTEQLDAMTFYSNTLAKRIAIFTD